MSLSQFQSLVEAATLHYALLAVANDHFALSIARVATLLSPWERRRHKLHIWTAIYDRFRQNGCSMLRIAGVAKGGREVAALAHIKSKFTHKYSHINGYSFRQTHRLNWNAARLSGCLPGCLAARPVGLIEAINCFDLPAVLPQHQPQHGYGSLSLLAWQKVAVLPLSHRGQHKLHTTRIFLRDN